MMRYNTKANKQVGNWLRIGVIMIFVQILLGGITRLTGSGLSITEWDLLLGTIPPLNKTQWLETFNKYMQFPQYEIQNQGMTLAEFKLIFFWEYIHRLWARTLGFVFLIPLIVFWKQKKIKNNELYKYILILVLGGAQGFMGWIMVKSGLVDMPWVSPIKLTMHLILATLLLVLCYRLSLERLYPQKIKLYEKSARKMFAFLIVLLFFQLALGGMVAGWKASIPYPTWPKMNDQWIPTNLFSLKPIWINFIENKATLQFMHRGMAYCITILIVFTVLRNGRDFKSSDLKQGRWFLIGIVFLQVGLGILTVINSQGAVPVLFGVLHQGTAFILLLTLVYFHYSIKYR